MAFRIVAKSGIIETASIYIFSLLLIQAFLRISFLHRFTGLLIPVVFLYLAVFASMAFRREPSNYGWTLKGWFGDILYVLLFIVIFFPLVFFTYYYYRRFFLAGHFHFTLPDDIMELTITHIIVVGLSEEAFFRGYLQKRLDESISGNALKIYGLSLSWGLIFANILWTITHVITLGQLWRVNVFLPGIAFGILRDRRKSLLAPALFHGLSNVYMKILEASF